MFDCSTDNYIWQIVTKAGSSRTHDGWPNWSRRRGYLQGVCPSMRPLDHISSYFIICPIWLKELQVYLSPTHLQNLSCHNCRAWSWGHGTPFNHFQSGWWWSGEKHGVGFLAFMGSMMINIETVSWPFPLNSSTSRNHKKSKKLKSSPPG